MISEHRREDKHLFAVIDPCTMANVADVGVVRGWASDPYVRTYADGDWNDNLLSLNQVPGLIEGSQAYRAQVRPAQSADLSGFWNSRLNRANIYLLMQKIGTYVLSQRVRPRRASGTVSI